MLTMCYVSHGYVSHVLCIARRRRHLAVLSVSESLFKIALFRELIENLNNSINVSNKHNPQGKLDIRCSFRESHFLRCEPTSAYLSSARLKRIFVILFIIFLNALIFYT